MKFICGITLLGEEIQKKVTWCSTFAQRHCWGSCQ